ncbi:7-deoxyloganetic acid glucosyltransferase, partial [Mucuna pruriens]
MVEFRYYVRTEQHRRRSMVEAVGAHALIFPCPIPAHVGSMLKLAELLALRRLHVTFLNTDYIHNRLTRFGDIQALSACYPTLHFKTVSDCYDEGHHPGFGDRIGDIIVSITLHAKPFLRDILVCTSPGIPKVSCVIQDGIFGSLAADVAAELGIRIPAIHFRTISACCFWAYFCVPKLLDCKELPIRGIRSGDEDMDRIISNMPGMENLLRCRDLPSFCRPGPEGNFLDWAVLRTQQSLEADAVMLNTTEELEGPVLAQMRHHFPRLYTLGPLHHHLNIRKAESNKANDIPKFRNSLFEVEGSCMAWLDAQPQGSVLYVSFGSSTIVKRDELIEIWHGLVNSKKRFLWVMRPDIVAAKDRDDRIPAELEEGTRERGFIVGWAPQDEVLAHKAVGGFLTHSGWNSTLDSVVAGVPMICRPYFADQQINSRFVSEVWKLGLDMKDVCDRRVVEEMVNDLMVHRREEFLRSAQTMAVSVHKSVSPGGSSYSSLDDLFQYIKLAGQEND